MATWRSKTLSKTDVMASRNAAISHSHFPMWAMKTLLTSLTWECARFKILGWSGEPEGTSLQCHDLVIPQVLYLSMQATLSAERFFKTLCRQWPSLVMKLECPGQQGVNSWPHGAQCLHFGWQIVFQPHETVNACRFIAVMCPFFAWLRAVGIEDNRYWRTDLR